MVEHPVYIEQLGCVQMETIVGSNGIYYAVSVQQREERITIWSETVLFGLDRQHRAGGYAFRKAALKQIQVAEDRKAQSTGA